MKKTLSINIAGIVFHIEEDAFATLDAYLKSIHAYFKNFEGAKNMTDYEVNLHKVFAPAYKALKYSRTMTLTFNNKDMGAWLALLLSIFRCGFFLEKKNIIFHVQYLIKSFLENTRKIVLFFGDTK